MYLVILLENSPPLFAFVLDEEEKKFSFEKMNVQANLTHPHRKKYFFILLSFEKKTSILIFVNLFAQHFTSPYSCELNFRDETSDSRIRSLTNIELAKQRDDVASNFSLEFSFENSLDIKVFRICKRN